MMKTFCPHEGGITHDDDSVFLNILAIDGIRFRVICPPFRTVFQVFFVSTYTPRNKTHIPWLSSPNQGKIKNQKTNENPPSTFKSSVRDTKSKSRGGD